jgi:hypothetical protein
MKSYFQFVTVLLLLTFVTIHCHKKSPEADFILEPDVFTNALMNNSDIKGLVPLGNLNPPGHVFPTDHLYLYSVNALNLYPVFSPGKLKLIRVKKYTYPTFSEYTLEMSPGGNYVLIYGHVSELDAALLGLIGSIADNCQSYTTGGVTFNYCEKYVNISLTGGQQIGRIGGHTGEHALDVGLQKNNSNTNIEYFCPLNYCTPVLKAQLEARLGNFNGTQLRTLPPVCGEINQNKTGSLQGNWVKKGEPKNPEDPHSAFVHDNVNPVKPVISVGVSQTGLVAGTYTFVISPSGTTNRDFRDVVPGTNYCYQNLNTGISSHLIIEFVNENEIKVETKSGTNCVGGEIFTAAAVLYTRLN